MYCNIRYTYCSRDTGIWQDANGDEAEKRGGRKQKVKQERWYGCYGDNEKVWIEDQGRKTGSDRLGTLKSHLLVNFDLALKLGGK